ncbi:YTH-domain-containing protein [Ceraceosorus guamensis]|uniref:YTH-domain-containing protein n=1 Tax=Ceraceosorus guamensis TaxID=1522189 RepID=A0A316W170_9BASI|nr:YTH-domain-containing protein [Ceraceosorus guamensis]PWN43596.1 YTH-domain-containing protein [Ceraceosorus guamensis]
MTPSQTALAPPPALSPEVQRLIASRGFNPANFDLEPANARWFVIKSFTEDDVQRSLKYEIWASTEKGNARLDKAWRESAHLGPLYLFFSVNASGHFNGMAQMLTPLDYSTSSNVWAQEGKWKGTFKVRWIYVKDVPNSQLRHIRLTNTPENKPITQSRDTQELPVAAGKELIRIMHGYSARTTLLQDWAFYEAQQESQRQVKQQPDQQIASASQGNHGGPLDLSASKSSSSAPGHQNLSQSQAFQRQPPSQYPPARHPPPRAIASPSPRPGQQQ